MPRNPFAAGDRDRRRGTDRRRHGPGSQRIYCTAAWRRFRLQVLAGEPLCRECRVVEGQVTAATDVDHVIDIADGGAVFDRANVQPLCGACHKRKSGERARRLQAQGGAKKFASEGR